MLDFDVIDGWEEEMEKMNDGKIGEPYHYPDSFVMLLGYMWGLLPPAVQTY